MSGGDAIPDLDTSVRIVVDVRGIEEKEREGQRLSNAKKRPVRKGIKKVSSWM